MLKISYISLIILLLFFSLAGCKDDDWSQYENYTKALDILIATEMSSVSDIIPEMNIIAAKYESNVVLTEVILTFEGNNQVDEEIGDICFSYFYVSDIINQATKIDLYYDMEAKRAYKIKFERGHGKRVRGISIPLGNTYTNLPISEMFSLFYENSEYKRREDIENIEITFAFSFDSMNVRMHDEDKNESYNFNSEFYKV